jgi:hypothetical protein
MAVAVMVAFQPACCSVAAGASRGSLGPAGRVEAWYDPVFASGRLSRWRWR